MSDVYTYLLLETNQEGTWIKVPVFLDDDATYDERQIGLATDDDIPDYIDGYVANITSDERMSEVDELVAEAGLHLTHPDRAVIVRRNR